MRIIQNYEVVREIGRGAFGKVFLAKRDGKDYAIKETHASGEIKAVTVGFSATSDHNWVGSPL